MCADTKSSYETLIRHRVDINPCLASFQMFLRKPQIHAKPCEISIIDYNRDGSQISSARTQEWKGEIDSISLTSISEQICGRLLIIEDISASMISSLGTRLNIDPMFFANYISTEFHNLEDKPPPPSLALFPSYWSSRSDMFHLQYQRVVDLGKGTIYNQTVATKTLGNVPRNVRRLPGLQRRHIGIARGCCSVWMKKIVNTWICTTLS